MATQQLVFVGSWTKHGSPFGIYVFRQDPETGSLTLLHTHPDVNAGFVAQHPSGELLFAVNENRIVHGEGEGAVTSYRINRETGELTFLGRRLARGGQTCHLTIDPTGRFLIAMNHEFGLVTVMPIEPDGTLGPICYQVQHKGPVGPHPLQRNQHTHFVTFDPGLRYVLINDKGIDRVMVYTFNGETGELTPNDPPFAQMRSGKGPRHMAFHPNGRWLYINGEEDKTITAFRYDGERGVLEEMQHLSTLPDDAPNDPDYNTAHILVGPGGKFVYVSNRYHNTVAIFAIDQETGWLTSVGHVDSQGHSPRNFAFDLAGRYVYVANHVRGGIVHFRVDPVTGGFTPTGDVTEAGNPSCLLFARDGYRISGFGG
jgi:6-phosphogluconolactonase